MNIIAILVGLAFLLLYTFMSRQFLFFSERVESSISASIFILLLGFYLRFIFLGVTFFALGSFYSEGVANVMATFLVGFTFLLFLKLYKEFNKIFNRKEKRWT